MERPKLRPKWAAFAVIAGLVVTAVALASLADQAAQVSPPTATTTTASPAPSASPSPSSPTTALPPAGGCAVKPSECGYPDVVNTGVPSGVKLRAVPAEITAGPGWRYDARGWISVDTDGAVVDSIDTTVDLNVTASNVTIKNSRINVSGEGWGVALRHTRNVTIVDNDIFGSANTGDRRLMVGIKDIYADSIGTAVLRNDIWNTSTGVQMEAGLIQDNYIHDMGYRSGDHLNGTTSNGGTSLLTLRHNTVFNQIPQTDAISLFQDFGPQANRVIDNNLLAGGGYTVYGGANPGKESLATNIKITNNRISRKYYPNGGFYGPIAAYNPAGTGNMWIGNIWDDTGEPITP